MDPETVDIFLDLLPAGTVVRWVHGGRFTYAALKAADAWYITGAANFYGKDAKTSEQLAGILARPAPAVTKVKVSTGWKPLPT